MEEAIKTIGNRVMIVKIVIQFRILLASKSKGYRILVVLLKICQSRSTNFYWKPLLLQKLKG